MTDICIVYTTISNHFITFFYFYTAKNYTSGGTVAVVLFGTATSVPITQNTDAWADRLRKESPSSASTKGSRRKPDSLVGSIARLVLVIWVLLIFCIFFPIPKFPNSKE